MESKTVFVMIDGLADAAYSSLDNKTYLQKAQIPNLDKLASSGLTGLLDPVETGLACGSDTAHMSIFGYDPFTNYEGRGSFETMGAGLPLTYQDIAFKCNFASLDTESGLVVRRRVSRKFYRWGLPLIEAIDNKPIPGYENYTVHVLHATEHRCGLKVSGPGLSHKIEGTDPLKDNLPLVVPKALEDSDPQAVFTAKLLQNLSNWIKEQLQNHPINIERVKNGKFPANTLLLRGCGVRLKVPSFAEKYNLKSFVIAPTAIIKGIGITFGMDVHDVPGATGDIYSNHKAKFDKASELITQNYQFGFVHIKAIDDLGHDKNMEGRIEMIQKLDSIIGSFVKQLAETNYKGWIVVTGDHTTHLHSGDHSYESVPFLATNLYELEKEESNFRDRVNSFDEISCSRGSLGRFPGSEVMPLIRSLMNIE